MGPVLEELSRAVEAGDELESVVAITQLGDRLHALVGPDIADPEEQGAEILLVKGIAADAARVDPSLEDVFVAATVGRTLVRHVGL